MREGNDHLLLVYYKPGASYIFSHLTLNISVKVELMVPLLWWKNGDSKKLAKLPNVIKIGFEPRVDFNFTLSL